MADDRPSFVDPLATPAPTTTGDRPAFVDPLESFLEDPMAGTAADERSFGEGLVEAASTVGSIGRGVLNAPISIAGGVAETVALAIDAGVGLTGAESNTAAKVENTFDAIKNVTGSKTKVGQVADDVASFGASLLVPALWVSKATAVARGLQTGKGLMGFAPKSALGRQLDKLAVSFGNSASGKALLNPKVLGVRPGAIAATAAGTFPISFAVSPSGRPTLSDSVDWMPDYTQTDQRRLEGSADTTRRFQNKLKNATEDAATGAAFDVLIGGGLALSKLAGKGATAVAKTDAAQSVIRPVKETTKKVYDAGIKDSMAENFVKRNLTSFKGLEPKAANEIELSLQKGKESDRVGHMAEVDFDLAARNALKAGLKQTDGSALDMAKIHEDIENIFNGKYTVDDVPYMQDTPELKRSVQRMQEISARSADDAISVLEEELVLAPPGTERARIAEEALQEIKNSRDNQITHLRRLFLRHEDPVAFYKQLDLESPEYNQTVQDMMNHMYGANMIARDATTEEARVLAEDQVREMLGLAATSSNLSNKELIKRAQQELREANTAPKDGLVFTRIPKFKQATDILESRKTFMDESKAAQALLKIVDEDPIANWRKTINDTNNMIATRDYYRSVPMTSLDDARQMLAQGGRPLVVKVPDETFLDGPAGFERVKPGQPGYQPGLEDNLQKTVRQVVEEEIAELTGYVKLGDASTERAFGGQFGELSGTYVAPEYYQAITAPYAIRNVGADFVYSLFQKARAGSQKLTVVPSVTANVRQMLGNGLMLGSNANMGADNLSLALRTQLANYADLEKEGLERTARKLSAAGVADEGVIVRTLEEYRDVGKNFSSLEIPNKLFDKVGDALGMRYFEKFYSGTDTVAKGAALFGEERKLLDVFNAAGIAENNPTITRAFIDNKLFSGAGEAAAEGAGKRKSFELLTPLELQAAEVVKDTMPTYSRIVEAAKIVDKVPIVGNFTSFAAENTRNAFNTVARGMREMAFEISPELRQQLYREGYSEAQVDAFEQGIRGNGAQRIGAFTTVNTILPRQLVKMSMYANGINQEEYDAILESSVADFLKESGHQIMILDQYGPGRYQAIDLSYTFPYAYLTDITGAALQTYELQKKLGKGDVEAAAKAALNGVARFGEPFTEETMIFERIADVMPESVPGGRGGRTKAQGTIYGPIDDSWDVARKSILHVLGGLTPEYTRLVMTEKNGEPIPGRLTKTAFGMESKQGVEGKYHDPYVEAMRLVSGFTPMELDSRTALEFAGKEYAGNRSDVRGAALRVLGDMESSPDKILGRWDDYLDALYKEQSRLYLEVQNMKTLGLSDAEIRQQLVRDAKIGRSEAAKIVNGMFAPGKVSSQTLASISKELKTEGRVRRAGDLVGLAQTMNKRMLEEVNKPLSYVPPEKTDRPAFVDPLEQSSATQLVAPAAAATMPPAMVAPVPAAPPASAPQGQVDPTLLGGDPATQALAKSLGRSQ